MNFMKAAAICILFFVQHNVLAAGGEGTGGGVGFLCSEGGEEKVYLADSYSLLMSRKVDYLRQVADTTLIDEAAKLFSQVYPGELFAHPYVVGRGVSIGYLLSDSYNSIKFSPEYIVEPLQFTNDDHIRQIPAGCKKVQIAVQNVAKGVVQVQNDFYWKLTSFERGLLHLHEALIALRRKPGADTSEIRALVLYFAKQLVTDDSVLQKELLRRLYTPTEVSSKKFLKTVFRAPDVFHCRSTYVYHGSRLERDFFLNRISGSGRPGSNNRYAFSLGSPDSSRWTPSRVTEIYTHANRHDRQLHGDLTISNIFQISRTSIWTTLETYDETTGVFSGSIKITNAGRTSLIGGINCFSQNVRLDYDREANHYLGSD